MSSLSFLKYYNLFYHTIFDISCKADIRNPLRDLRSSVTVHTPLSREVFWHEYAKIPRHISQNSIAAGNLE